MRLSQHFAAWAGIKVIFASGRFRPGSGQRVAGPSGYRNKIVVMVDQARIVKIPASAQTLVIGNPQIADVTLQNGVMIVTGKGFGETNFIALDAVGNPVARIHDPGHR